jgi:hypothetical protein
MKKPTSCLILLILTLSVYAQNSTATTADTRNALLQKAKNKSIAGWVLLGGGAVFTITGSVIMVDAIGGAFDHNDYNSKMNRGTILAVIGVAAMGGSIPLLISAHQNRKKAMALVITNKAIPTLQRGWWSYQSYPALSLKINFGRS